MHTLGSTAQAVASVLAAFLGGLAVGAVALGRRADRSTSPLRFYALLEATIAVFAIAFPLLNDVFHRIVLAAESTGTAAAAVRFLGTFVLLLPATAAMGGTHPMLCRVAVVRDKLVGRPVGALRVEHAWRHARLPRDRFHPDPGRPASLAALTWARLRTPPSRSPALALGASTRGAERT